MEHYWLTGDTAYSLAGVWAGLGERKACWGRMRRANSGYQQVVEEQRGEQHRRHGSQTHRTPGILQQQQQKETVDLRVWKEKNIQSKWACGCVTYDLLFPVVFLPPPFRIFQLRNQKKTLKWKIIIIQLVDICCIHASMHCQQQYLCYYKVLKWTWGVFVIDFTVPAELKYWILVYSKNIKKYQKFWKCLFTIFYKTNTNNSEPIQGNVMFTTRVVN